MMRSNGPVTLSLPPFRGTTRLILLTSIAVFVVIAVMGWFSVDISVLLLGLLTLQPMLALHKLLWQFVTYPFVSVSFVSLLFSGLQVWFFGSALEEERGTRWFAEYFFVTSIAGGLVASLVALVAIRHAVGGFPGVVGVYGLWPSTMALLVAFAYLHPNEQLRLYFVLPIKAKHLAMGYLVFYLVLTFFGGDRFGALTAVCVALAGYMYLRFAPRKGLRFAMSERWYGVRNDYYRAKRRRAAKKFVVYMKEQGKDASGISPNIDESGRYVDPSGTPRDPNDRRWMN